MVEADPLAADAAAAVAGDAAAMERLCRELQGPLYALAVRTFSNPADAADATQEALIRIVTHLSSFEGRSKLATWAYTVASRQYLRMCRTRTEQSVVGPAEFGAWIDQHRAEPSAELASSVEFDELCGDVRIACTYGMLLCLSRPLRLAYLLGDVVGFTDAEGADACEITPAAFRQRLARARSTMRDLMASRCGLIRADNPCRCANLVEASIRKGILDPAKLAYAGHDGVDSPIDHDTLAAAADELDIVTAISAVYRSDPAFAVPDQVMHAVSSLTVLGGT